MGSTSVDQSPQSRRSGPRAGGAIKPRSKVKSGCRTCKYVSRPRPSSTHVSFLTPAHSTSRFRKVKCDEGRPSCARCLSTGRICDGYGVWGGGGAEQRPGGLGSRQTGCPILSSDRPLLHLGPASPILLRATAIAAASSEEHSCLEWYRLRTALKMQGAFRLPFWRALVMRAALHEPAVFHAVLALSSVHRRASAGLRELGPEASPDEAERFALRHYGRAMGALLRMRGPGGGASERLVALVACMVFVCLELLRGRYRTGNGHLRNGMRLLVELEGAGNGTSNRDDAHACAAEAFTCMNLLAVQLGHGYWTAPVSVLSNCQRMPILFECPAQARKSLDNLVAAVLHLTRRGLAGSVTDSGTFDHIQEGLLEEQERVQFGLVAWLDTYKASRVRFDLQLSAVQKVGYHVLLLHHTMASIMACTSLRPDDEMAFDYYCREFATLVKHAYEVRQAVRAVHESGDPVFSPASERSLFTADIGWAPPLYYTAIHCRVRRIRLSATNLLRTLPSKEGFWCSALAASVSEEVVRIEEGGEDLGDSTADTDSFDAESLDFGSSPFGLGASQRVTDVQVVLPDSSEDQVVLVCKQINLDGSCQVITKGRHINLHNGVPKDCWKEIETRPEYI